MSYVAILSCKLSTVQAHVMCACVLLFVCPVVSARVGLLVENKTMSFCMLQTWQACVPHGVSGGGEAEPLAQN